MIKFQVEDKKPTVLVGLDESSGRVWLTLNGIKVAFLSPYTGRLGTFRLSDIDENRLHSLGVQVKAGYIEVD